MLCVKIRGLPYSADERQIRNFFADFRVAERDIIIDKAHGQPTGYALVFLESEAEALRAKNTLDREYVGNRYVDVFFPDVKK
jgi:RNA recognition motif-containing protein